MQIKGRIVKAVKSIRYRKLLTCYAQFYVVCAHVIVHLQYFFIDLSNDAGIIRILKDNS